MHWSNVPYNNEKSTSALQETEHKLSDFNFKSKEFVSYLLI